MKIIMQNRIVPWSNLTQYYVIVIFYYYFLYFIFGTDLGSHFKFIIFVNAQWKHIIIYISPWILIFRFDNNKMQISTFYKT